MEKPWLKHYDPGVPTSIEYPAVPLFHFLEEAARQFPNVPATIFFNNKLTYGQLDALVNRFANALIGLGVKKGDRVALYMPNCPQFLIGYFGILKAGGVVVATNPLYAEREVEFQLNDAGVETVLVLSRFYGLLKKVQPRTRIKNVIVTNIKEYFPPVLRLLFTLAKEKKEGHHAEIQPGDSTLNQFLANAPATKPNVPVAPDDIALFQYTGGTTGTSKGAISTHAALVANTLQIRAWLGKYKMGGECYMGALPLFHVYGMVACMNSAISTASSIVLVPQFKVDEVLPLINKYKPSLFPGVPTMYVAINNHPEVGKYDLRSIRACISGAAPLPVSVKLKFEEISGGKLVEGYGLSEAPTATHCNPLNGVNKPGSIGLPLPDVECKIMDIETGEKEMPVGEIGELCIRAPQVMKGYWNKPEETARALRNGWLYTGDIAKMDEEGYFYIVDRKKDMIIVGGFNVYPRDVEEVLYKHPKVKEAAVVGIPDPYRGETVKAYVVLKPGETATTDEIIAYCKENMAKFKVPSAVEFRDQLPKTMVGKILRRVLLEEEKQKIQS